MGHTATLPPREDGFIRRKMSVRDCQVLVKNGLLDPDKYELIEGEIVLKPRQDRAHICVVTLLIVSLSAIFRYDSIQTHAQIGIGERDEFNDPEPDVAVLKGSVTDYLDREPNPATEILLAVEVANTSLKGDLTTKAKIYARNGVQEYWVVSIPDRALIVCREPEGEGYTNVINYRGNESVAPIASPHTPVSVTDIVP